MACVEKDKELLGEMFDGCWLIKVYFNRIKGMATLLYYLAISSIKEKAGSLR